MDCREVLSILDEALHEEHERYVTAMERLDSERRAYVDAVHSQLLRDPGDSSSTHYGVPLPQSLVDWRARILRVEQTLSHQWNRICAKQEFYEEQRCALRGPAT